MPLKDIDWADLSEKECKGRSLRIRIKENVYFRFNERKGAREKFG